MKLKGKSRSFFLSNFAWNTYSKSYMVQFTPWHVTLGGIRINQA